MITASINNIKHILAEVYSAKSDHRQAAIKERFKCDEPALAVDPICAAGVVSVRDMKVTTAGNGY